VLLVLDATVGQNALSQVEVFLKTAGVTGLVMTKLDGIARGGILVAIAARSARRHFIGVGESVDDLAPLRPRILPAPSPASPEPRLTDRARLRSTRRSCRPCCGWLFEQKRPRWCPA
jgi:fused signal recognition particle receptor